MRQLLRNMMRAAKKSNKISTMWQDFQIKRYDYGKYFDVQTNDIRKLPRSPMFQSELIVKARAEQRKDKCDS